MADRVVKSLNKTGRISRLKARAAVRAVRREEPEALTLPKGKLVITKRSTATGKRLVAFRGHKLAKLGSSKH